MNEFDIIKSIILRYFNIQYQKEYIPDDFDIITITPAVNFRYGYEISSKTTVDYFRIRVYLNEGDYDNLSKFRIELNYPTSTSKLGDEVYVAVGSIDKYYRETGKVKFLKVNTRDKAFILLENSNILLAENGSALLLE